MIEEITKFNSFDPKALYSALEYLSRLLKEDSETLEVYIKNHSDEYESSITLGRKGWAAPFYLDNYFLDFDCDAVKLAKDDLNRFEEKCENRDLLKHILNEIDRLNYLNDDVYYNKAKKYLEYKDYFIVALCLLPLLESIASKIVSNKDKNRGNKERYGEKNFKERCNDIFNTKIKDRVSKDLFVLNIFPSLQSYMNLIYCTSNVEWQNANTFKRDTIMHGKNKYDIKKIDCIRLFNAVYVASYVVDTLDFE